MNISAWAPVLLPALLALIALFVPGFALTWALGLDRFRWVVFAPLAAMMLIGVSAIIGAKLNLRFGWLLLFGFTVVVAGLVYAARLLLQKRLLVLAQKRCLGLAQNPQQDPLLSAQQQAVVKPRLRPVLLGTLLGLPFAVVPFIMGVGRPEYPSQTWDGMFHLSAVRWILKTGNGSSLNLSAVGHNLTEAQHLLGGVYPAGFHDLVALSVVNGEVTVATHAVVLVIAGILWPFALGSLVTTLFPKARVLPIFAVLAGATYSSFPEQISAYGVLWPTVLAYALVPLLLIVLLDWFGRTNLPMTAKTTVIGLIGVVGMGLTHPSSIYVALLALLPLAVDFTVRIWRKSLVIPAYKKISFATVMAGLFTGLYLVSKSPVLQDLASWQRAGGDSLLKSAASVIFEPQGVSSGSSGNYIEWALGVFLLIGAVVALRMSGLRWLLAAWLLAGYAYVLAAMVHLPFYELLAPWYNDPLRLRAILPLFNAPLAAIGVWFVYQKLGGWLKLDVSVNKQRLLAVVMLPVLFVAFNQFGVPGGAVRLANDYTPHNVSGTNGLINPQEVALIKSLPKHVAPSEMIIGDPRNGLPLVYALTGQKVSFRHIYGAWSSDFMYLAENFHKVSKGDAKACTLLKKHNIRYFYADRIIYWPENPAGRIYAGFQKAQKDLSAFKPVVSGGGATLYKITSCD